MIHKTTKFILLALLISFGLSTIAQVSINNDGSNPDASAMLEVKSSDKGFLPPRMTTTEIGNITSPANGLFVFNTTDNKAYIFVSADNEWKEVNYGTGTIAAPFNCGGVLIDDRDSKSYTTVLIGDQCWMAENLNVGTRIDGSGSQTENSTIEKYCYDDNTINCDIYGGMYQWNEMMQYVISGAGVQGICPDGWHIPTDDEWTTLTDYLGGISVAGGKMKETGTVHWISPNIEASNSSGFTGFGGGFSYPGTFGNFGQSGFWWSSSERSVTGSWYRSIYRSQSNGYRGDFSKTYSSSVRCLKN